jgi:hypothetical protein
MSGKSYLYEKLLSAIGTMATSSRTLQERLRSAALTCIAVKEDDLPEGELRDKCDEIQQRLTSVKPTATRVLLKRPFRRCRTTKLTRSPNLCGNSSVNSATWPQRSFRTSGKQPCGNPKHDVRNGLYAEFKLRQCKRGAAAALSHGLTWQAMSMLIVIHSHCDYGIDLALFRKQIAFPG